MKSRVSRRWSWADLGVVFLKLYLVDHGATARQGDADEFVLENELLVLARKVFRKAGIFGSVDCQFPDLGGCFGKGLGIEGRAACGKVVDAHGHIAGGVGAAEGAETVEGKVETIVAKGVAAVGIARTHRAHGGGKGSAVGRSEGDGSVGLCVAVGGSGLLLARAFSLFGLVGLAQPKEAKHNGGHKDKAGNRVFIHSLYLVFVMVSDSCIDK